MTTNWQQPPGAQPPGSQPNQHPNNQNKGRRFAVVAVLLVVIAGLAAGAGLFMANRDNVAASNSDGSYVVTETVASEPVFEPRDAAGESPFYPLEVQLTTFQAEMEENLREDAAELLEDADEGAQVEVPTFDVEALDEAVKTGLYGGTAENTCDPERLISFLYANPDLGEAWAWVQGITFAEIADYIRSLDVRVLAEPVNVLNHGFDVETGAPYEIDTILDAGTAVLVDANGDIRTRCYCGNPIKPKPPEHMPPRCVVWIEHVYIEPGGTNRREDAVRDVLLTNRETTVGGARWIEVKWGTDDSQMGWVRSDNLRNHYCPPPRAEWTCPGPGAVPVWADHNENDQVGWHTGTLNTLDGPRDIFGPVETVGGLNPLVVNDFIMVRFTQAAASVQNTGWVRLADLNQDEKDCVPIAQCVETNGQVWKRAGGAIHSPGGIMNVEFTGRFVKKSPITHAEVRLVEEGGTLAWINNLYTPLSDDDCGERYECVTDHGGLGTYVYETSTQMLNDHLGHLYNAVVDVTGPAENGRVPINMAPGGPAGWVDQQDFSATLADCVPEFYCYMTTGPAYTVFPTNGDVLAAQPTGVEIGIVGKQVDGIPIYERIEHEGIRYWIDRADLVPLADEDCDTPPPACPTDAQEQLVLSQELGNDIIGECCVRAIYETTDLSTPVADVPTPVRVVVEEALTVDNGAGPENWYRTSTDDFFPETHVLDGSFCEPRCPTPNDYETLDSLAVDDGMVPVLEIIEEPGLAILVPTPPPVEADCCISVGYTDRSAAIEAAGPWPRLVEVDGGPYAPAPGWFLTADGAWFDTFNVLPAAACEMISCPTATPGVLDLTAAKATTQHTTTASSTYVGNEAECCAEGDIHSGPSDAENLGAPLTMPTTVIVIGIEGDWYRVVIQDFVAWIHVSQFLDASECGDMPVTCSDLDPNDPGPDPDDTVLFSIAEIPFVDGCCIAGRVLTVAPSLATPADWISIDPTEAEIVDSDLLTDDGPWAAFDTDDHGVVWAPLDRIVDESECDMPVTCPGTSEVAVAIADDFVNGVATYFYSCCVSFQSAAAGPAFKVVTLNGETDEAAGVVTYYTTEDEAFIDSDFVDASNCEEPPPFTCDNGQSVDTPSQCPSPTPVPQPTPQPRPTLPPPVTCVDSDQDTVCDEVDNCDFDPNVGQEDVDGDGIGNVCDLCPRGGDEDGDGVCDVQDNCRVTPNFDQANSDGDGVGDACDNCPFVTNGFQEDTDGDRIGDACERPECPSDRVLPGDRCCPAGSVADGPECFCVTGAVVVPGQSCDDVCPQFRQVPGGQCCPDGAFAETGGCFTRCPDQSAVPLGNPCTKVCADGSVISVADQCELFLAVPVLPACGQPQQIPTGGCCPPGQIPFPLDTAPVTYECFVPIR